MILSNNILIPLLTFFSILPLMATSARQPQAACITRIKKNAARDSINLEVLPFLEDALVSIASIAEDTIPAHASFATATRIDTHTHPVPSWFRALQPLAAGRETPSWNVSSHLGFMAAHKIKRSILCISTPQANAFPGEKEKTTALARLLNEYVAEVVRVFPDRFSWIAITALPYVEESLGEVRYALDELGAMGVGVLTNHEGAYPGDECFGPLWKYLQSRPGSKEVVFVHPTEPVIRLEDGRLINSNPCKGEAIRLDKKLTDTKSTSAFGPRRVLLRDCSRNIFDYSKSHYH